MATRHSSHNAARQSASQPTTKPKGGKTAVKSAESASKKSTARKAAPQATTGSKRGRQETPEQDGKGSLPDVLSPSEKRQYDRLKAKMELAAKRAAADRRTSECIISFGYN